MQAGELVYLKISDILPNRFQPRIKFDDESLNQLAISIARFGVIEPIVVRPTGKKYEIIAGERRFKASKLAGISTIPCMVVSLSDKDSEELALLENVQRKALSPIEEAVSYKRILDSGYITRDELSKKIGKPQSLIFGKIKLLELSDEVQNYLLNNKISERHARSLLQLGSLSEQNEMLHRIVNERLTVKATDREIDKILKNKRKIKVSDDDTETLFDDERGKDKMDIDKIMQEAKDINPEEAPTTSQAPNLMATGMDKPSEPLGGQGASAPVNEPGKFVSVSQPAAPASSPTTAAPTGVTFDNMFAAPVSSQPLSTENVTNGSIASNPAVDNNSSNLDTLMTGVTPLVQPSMTASPNLTAPMDASNTQTSDGSAEISNLMSGIIPDSFSGASNSQSNVLPSSPIVNDQTGSQALSNNVSESLPQSITDNSQLIQPVSPVSSEVSETALPSQPTVQPAPAIDEPTFTPQPAEPVQPAPAVSEPTFISQPASPVQATPAVSEPASVSQQVETIPEVSVSNLNSISSDNVIPMPTSSNSDRVVINTNPTAGQSISDAVSDALNKANTASDANASQVSTVNSGVSDSTLAPMTENVVTDVSSVPNYAKVVQMLRECADEIKKNGYYVGVEEVEVDGKYKVIFTIDK